MKHSILGGAVLGVLVWLASDADWPIGLGCIALGALGGALAFQLVLLGEQRKDLW